jgi:hypothetical protein
MSVTSAPFRPDYMRVKGMQFRWPERARFAQVRLPGGARAGQGVRPGLSEALPAWEHQRRGRPGRRDHERDHRGAIGGTSSGVTVAGAAGPIGGVIVRAAAGPIGGSALPWSAGPMSGPARPGRRLLEHIDLELQCLLLCAKCFTGHRLPGFRSRHYPVPQRQGAGRWLAAVSAGLWPVRTWT